MNAQTKDINSTPLWTALITPFLENGEVDYDSLKKLLNEQQNAGNGILILGSTGEALNLSTKVKKEIIDFVDKQNLSAPLMAGVGGHELEACKEWVDFLNTKNYDCYLMVTPLYAKPESKGQIAWFKTLMDKSQKPVMLYNVPGRTGKKLGFDVVKELSTHQNFWAVKEASGSTDDFKQYVAAAGSNPRVYSGDDALTPDFAPLGCVGLVSVASNVWPAPVHLYATKILEKTLSEDDIKGWEDACNSLFEVSNPIPAKVVMNELGMITTPLLKLPLTHEDLPSCQKQIKANDWVANWYQNNK
jgi:4-hydroxy-tetrahydrodipicolinate synthase